MEFGDRVKDTITDFEGVIVGRAQYITGCDQVLLAPKSKEGEYKDSMWFDVDRCTVTKSGAITLESVMNKLRPGHDREAPKK